MSRRFALVILLALILSISACGPSPGASDANSANPFRDQPSVTGQDTNAANEGEASESDSATGTSTDAGESSAARRDLEVNQETVTSDEKGITVGFTTDGYAFRGNPEAPVLMEEFSDYQCPFCGRFYAQTLPSLEEEKVANGEVVIVFYDFPLTSIHPEAMSAHEAAHCAGSQGADNYWAMHDMLFENINQWSGQANTKDIFAGYANEIDLDTDQFESCMDANTFREQVQSGISLGRAQGVNSTPSFFLNGQPLVGAQPLNVFTAAINTLAEGGTLAPDEPEPAAGAVPTPAAISDQFAAAQGDPGAPVTIVEYTDYQCPFCLRHVNQTMPQLQQLINDGEVYYIVKDFPLENIHPEAKGAAVAARCAGDQDAYWPMHDLLFANQENWAGQGDAASTVFGNLATELNLNKDEFDSCFESGRYESDVEANLAEGTSLGVRGTPSFFIDGFPVRGAQPYELFEYAVGLAKEGTLADAYRPQEQPTPAPQPQGPVDVPLGDAPGIGDPNAPVVIIEYTDYQCPFCSRHFQETYPLIVENYVETGQVYYVFKDFPLTSIHAQAVDAAEAARCARDQGAFLEMHDILFGRQQQWAGQSNAPSIFAGYAEELDLDTEAFTSCLSNNTYEDAVMAELQEGASLGVNGTPAFFVNGRFVNGAQPYSVFEQAINQAAAEAE